MLAEASGVQKIYIACGYTNLRRGIDGLAQTYVAAVNHQLRSESDAPTLGLLLAPCREQAAS